MTPPLQRGEFVVVTADGRTVDAMVTLASSNGRSIMLMYEAILGRWAGTMAAFIDDAGQWVALDGMPLQIARKPRPS